MSIRTIRGRGELLAPALLLMIVISCRQAEDQVALAQLQAGGRLAVTTDHSAPKGAPDVTVRRLLADGYTYFYASSISPDGRYLSVVDYSTSDLAVRDLQTGETHRLTNAPREEGEPRSFRGEAQVSVFSRDGRRIVVAWYDPDPQLVVLDFTVDDTGTPRPAEPAVIFHNPQYDPAYPFDWSPDGREILAKVYVAGNTNQLALISTADGTYRALKSFDWREPGLAKFSPDGKYVAYDFPPEADSPDRDVFVVSVDGTRETRIADGRLLGWLPDGSLLFDDSRDGTPAMWRVPVADGRASGRPELVKADMWGVEPLGFAGSRFYYGVVVDPRRLYVAAADLEAGRLTGPPVSTDVDPRGWDWSPDGKFLAYSSSQAIGSVIGLWSPDRNEYRNIHLDLHRTRLIQWDPDGRSLILFSSDAKGRHGFHRVDLASGTSSTILVTDGTEYATNRGHFAASPDGRTLYFTRGDPRAVFGRRELIAFDLESGTARHVADVSSRDIWSPVAISPDGSRLAVVYPGAREREGVVGTIPATGGDFTPLDTIPPDVHVRMMGGWTADNRWIYWTTIRPQADESPYRLWIAPAAGGKVQEVQLPDGLGALVRVHPDGRRIAFVAGTPRGEVWVMEGLGGTSHAEQR